MTHHEPRLPADRTSHPSGQAGASPFVFSDGEQAAIVRILRDFPEAVTALEASLRAILEQLIPPCRGRLHSADDADYLLVGLADRVVASTIKGEPDALRTMAIDLATRHLLGRLRCEFHRRVLEGHDRADGASR